MASGVIEDNFFNYVLMCFLFAFLALLFAGLEPWFAFLIVL